MGIAARAFGASLGVLIVALCLPMALRAFRPNARRPKRVDRPAEVSATSSAVGRWLEHAGFVELCHVQNHLAPLGQLFVNEAASSYALLWDLQRQDVAPDLLLLSRCEDGFIVATAQTPPGLPAEPGAPQDPPQAWTAHRQALARAHDLHGPARAPKTADVPEEMIENLKAAGRTPQGLRNAGLLLFQLALAGALLTTGATFPGLTAAQLIAPALALGGLLFIVPNAWDLLIHFRPWLKRIRVVPPTPDQRPGVALAQQRLERLGFRLVGRQYEGSNDDNVGMPVFLNEATQTWANICFQPHQGAFGYFVSHFERGHVVLTWTNVFQEIDAPTYHLSGALGFEAALEQHQRIVARLKPKAGELVKGKSFADRVAVARQYYRNTVDLRSSRPTVWSLIFSVVGAVELVLAGIILLLTVRR